VLCRRRRCTGPPFVPASGEHSAQLATQCLSPKALVLVCLGAAAAGVLSGAWYGFAVPPRRTSSGHAIQVCGTGAVASCATRRCALGQTRTGLAVWVVRPRGCGAAKTAGSAPLAPFLAAARRRLGGGGGGEWRGLTDFDPPRRLCFWGYAAKLNQLEPGGCSCENAADRHAEKRLGIGRSAAVNHGESCSASWGTTWMSREATAL
jgi:hypothetical protein